MKWAAMLIILLLAVDVAAIDMLKDKRPDSVPADAKAVVKEDISVAPDEPQTLTNVTIERIVPAKVNSGDTFTVTLKVTNHYSGALNILVVDPQRQGVAYIGGPEPYIVNYESLEIPLFRWKERISPGETKEYTYKIKAGNPGTITFPPASVNDDYGNTFESKPMFVTVACKPSGTCAPGENYINCPTDCPTGSRDDVCDGVADGKTDPDCAPGTDPDSASTTTSTMPASKPLTSQNKPASACNLLLLPLYTVALALLTKRLI